MGLPPDPGAARERQRLDETLGMWSALWIQDLRGEQHLDEDDWLLWCVPFVDIMAQRPANVDMLEDAAALSRAS